MGKKNRELEEQWKQVYETCLKSVNDYSFSELDGFQEVFPKYLKAIVLIKQSARKPISLTEASNLSDLAAKQAVSELRSYFKERNEMKAIVNALRDSSVLTIPGSKSLNKAHIRTINLVISLKTHTLSTQEIRFITSKFAENAELDPEQFMMTIKCHEFFLEGPEPTQAESIAIQKEAQASVPAIIAYIASDGDYKVPWKDFFLDVSERIRQSVSALFNSLSLKRDNSGSNVLDASKLADLFEEPKVPK